MSDLRYAEFIVIRDKEGSRVLGRDRRGNLIPLPTGIREIYDSYALAAGVARFLTEYLVGKSKSECDWCFNMLLMEPAIPEEKQERWYQRLRIQRNK